MKLRVIGGLVVGFLSLGSHAKTVYVDAAYSGGDNDGSAAKPYVTITQGLGASVSGDKVLVYEGVYPEHFTVQSGISVVGVNRGRVIVQGTAGYTVVTLYGALENITIRGPAKHGVYTYGSLCSLESVSIKECETGVFAHKSSSIFYATNCAFYGNEYAVREYGWSGTENHTYDNCSFIGNTYGLFLTKWNGATICDLNACNIWLNTGSQITNTTGGITLSVTNSIVEGGGFGLGNIDLDFNGHGTLDVLKDFSGNGVPDAVEDFNGNGMPDAVEDFNGNGIPDSFESKGMIVPFDTNSATFGAVRVQVTDNESSSIPIDSFNTYHGSSFKLDWDFFMSNNGNAAAMLYRVDHDRNASMDYSDYEKIVFRTTKTSDDILLTSNACYFVHMIPLLDNGLEDYGNETTVRIMRDHRKPFVRSTTHQESSKWYQKPIVRMEFMPFHADGGSVSNFFFVWDHFPNTTPTTSSLSTTNFYQSFLFQPDGTYFFHVRSQDMAGNLSEAAHFQVNIGTGARWRLTSACRRPMARLRWRSTLPTFQPDQSPTAFGTSMAMVCSMPPIRLRPLPGPMMIPAPMM